MDMIGSGAAIDGGAAQKERELIAAHMQPSFEPVEVRVEFRRAQGGQGPGRCRGTTGDQ